MRFYTKVILGLIVTSILLLLLVWQKQSMRHSDNSRPHVEVLETTYHKRFIIEHEATGIIRAQNEHFLSVKNGGKLQAIYVSPGQNVSASQVIAMVDETLRKSRLEQALSSFSLAQSEHQRVSRLFRAGAATAQERDEATTMLAVRRTELQTTRQDLEDALIRTPVDGFLVMLAFREGDYVPDGSRVAVVEQRDHLKVVTKVPYEARDLLGEQLTISLAAFDMMSRQPVGDWYELHASATLMRENTIFDGASIDIVLTFPAEATPLTVGQSVILKIPTHDFSDVFSVAEVALTEVRGVSVVVLETPSSELIIQPVALIHRYRNQVMIRGIRPDMVVVNPRVLDRNPQLVASFKTERKSL